MAVIGWWWLSGGIQGFVAGCWGVGWGTGGTGVVVEGDIAPRVGGVVGCPPRCWSGGCDPGCDPGSSSW